MTEPLHLKYRPRKFVDMVGQRLTAVVLDQMVERDRVPSALLFAGPSGVGKTTAARILASRLSPEADTSLSVIEVDAASHGGVADIRALLEQIRYSSGGSWRIVILDEAHSLSRDAFNALLKTLEEPPPGTIFVLVTTEPHKIPETVLTRLMEFEFRRVSAEEIFDRLVSVANAEGITVSTEVLQRIALDAGGSVRQALMSLEKADLADLRAVTDYVQATAIRDLSGKVLLALAMGETARAFEIVDVALSSIHPLTLAEQVTRSLRHIMVLRGGGQVPVSGQDLEVLQRLMALLEADRVFAAIRLLWDLKTKVRVSDDPRGSLDLVLALIGDVFTRGRQAQKTVSTPAPAPAVEVPAPAPVEAPRKVSLDEMEI